MVKVHTRFKRMQTKTRGRGERKVRPKTFSTEAAAKKYAEAAGISKYTLENLKSSSAKVKKIRIVT